MWLTIEGTDEKWWLSSLAQKWLGSWERYNEIYEANKDVMVDANTVYPGLKLWIPIEGKPKPTTVTATNTATQPGVTTVYTNTQTPGSEFSLPGVVEVGAKVRGMLSKLGNQKVLLIGGVGLAGLALAMNYFGNKSRTA